ncbi:hypothetical protein SLEP1_g15717 [Rubroshorea leprosula]|uniref:Uncharacterized protein n=1 Tax=Rubroshorea leprosula TaxID=152421 RepID=A0AAV5INB8_9ROSI|nr:hypothetical protein SLEP1_g15717 [Rubroshorea leprosula]
MSPHLATQSARIIPHCSRHPSLLRSSLIAPVIPHCSSHPSLLRSSLIAPIIYYHSNHHLLLPQTSSLTEPKSGSSHNNNDQ